MLIGTPKSLDEIPVLPVEALKQLEEGALQNLAQGLPLEVPIAMPFGQLVQLAKTLKVYCEIAARLDKLPNPEDGAPFEECVLEVQAAARELLAFTPPPPPTVQPAKAPSKIILPK